MLHAVIDFGSLTVGHPDAEHATVWGLPPEARQAYWNTLNLDDLTWTRARAWAIAIILYYGRTWPRHRLVSQPVSRACGRRARR
ncbi:hypothetical protein ABN028_12670 [Actinopolymorpha sp. B17G11]|uniref:hypothetical protein n=1 Tax=Actinopolymorpha sp. B17G11 TaxID=3160861 RepID=UPI0032E3D321